MYEPYLRLWLEIWESVLQLAFTQTLALCSHAKMSLKATPDGTLANQEQLIRNAWPHLARLRFLSPWLHYIGRQDGPGEPFLQGASKPLRDLRNELSHSFSRDNWATLVEQHQDALLFLIDALAFWVENPLLTRLQFHPMRRNWVQAQALLGDQLPFPIREFEVPDLTANELPAESINHVWLLWPQEGGTRVLDLDPFIVLESDQQGYPHIRLLSYPARQAGYWMYRSLRDGRLQARALSPAAQQTVQAVFR